MSKKSYRPQNKTIVQVITYLEEELGLSVYGTSCDLNSGQFFEGLRDFTADEVVQFRKLLEADELWTDEVNGEITYNGYTRL